MIKHLAPADAVFWAASAFMAGVFAASSGWNLLPMLGAAAAGTAAFALFLQKPRRIFWLSTIFIAIFIFGAIYFHLYFNVKSARENIVLNKKLSFSGIVADEPKIYEKYQSLEVALALPLRGTIRVLASPSETIHYGDELMIKGSIDPPRSIADMSTAAFPKTEVVAEHKGFWLKEKLLDFKSAILKEFKAHFSTDDAALLGGITLGGTNGMSDNLRNSLIASGMSYIISSYGLKMAMIAFAISILTRGFLPRRAVFCAATIATILFLLIAGGAPSAVRGAVMVFMALLAREIGRVYDARNALTLTAAGIIFADPGLIQDVAFTMSFSSVLGILYLVPALKHALYIKDNAGDMADVFLLACAAQIAVLPASIAAFDSFPLGSIPASFLITEFVPVTMFFGVLLAGVNILSPYFGSIVAKFAAILLAYESRVVIFFADFPMTVSAPLGSPFVGALACAAALLAFCWYFSPRITVMRSPDSDPDPTNNDPLS